MRPSTRLGLNLDSAKQSLVRGPPPLVAASLPVPPAVCGPGWLQKWGIHPAVRLVMALGRHPEQGGELEELAVVWSSLVIENLADHLLRPAQQHVLTTRNKNFGKMLG